MIHTIKNIHKALYGLDVSKSIDVTEKLIAYFRSTFILHTHINVNQIFSDPYRGRPKHLFIYENESGTPLCIRERNNVLKNDILYERAPGSLEIQSPSPAPDPTLPVIGIYGVFIGIYSYFYENFILNMETYFLPGYKKIYYIVTDQDLPEFNDRTYFHKTEIIDWPYPVLYRYKYFLKFPLDIVHQSSVIYFLNSNAVCVKTITNDILPDPVRSDGLDGTNMSGGYVFTQHARLTSNNYHKLYFEKNAKSTACIPLIPDSKYVYCGSRFFGAITDRFLELCEHLNRNTDIDEQNNFIAKWHDESHINHYANIVLKHKYKILDISYHAIHEWSKYSINTNIVYLCKERLIPLMPKKKGKIRSGKIILNNLNKHLIH